MSDLTTFRDHARRLSTAEHGDECEAVWHEPDLQGSPRPTRREKPNPHCPGCITDADRRLWTQLADEIDTYLTTPTDDQPLLEEDPA